MTKLKFLFIILTLLYLFLPKEALAQQKVYIAPDDHTDYIWTASEATYRQLFKDMIDYYLAQADATAGNPSDFQSRFNLDGSYWMYVYEQDKTPAQFQNLINKIKSGHINVAAQGLAVVFGGQPTEAVIRGLYYPGMLERQYGIDFKVAMAMENMTMPFGLGSLWAGSGVKYSWQGVCNCATVVTNANNRPNQVYWWKGIDGSRVLMKWYNYYWNEGIGGYSEARHQSTINQVTSSGFTSTYPYNIFGLFGQGWDDDHTDNLNLVNWAQAETNAGRRVRVSNEYDFFEDMEATYGPQIPEQSLSFGNEWEIDAAAITETFAVVRRAVERLRNVESIATLVSLKNTDFMTQFTSQKKQTWMNIGIFWEHDLAATAASFVTERLNWQKRLASEVNSYVNALEQATINALSGMIAKESQNEEFFVYNSLSWARTEIGDYRYTGATPVHVIDNTTGQEVPSQVITKNGQQHIRILASDIPPVGYKTYQVVQGAGSAFPNAVTVTGNQMENSIYRLTVANRGAITSLFDKARNKEFARQINSRFINDMGASTGTITTENVGPVSATIVATAGSPVSHTTRVTLYKDVDRIDIENTITQAFDSTQTYSYAFSLDNPQTYHEELGTIIKAAYPNGGGYYSPTISRLDWLTMNHFVDMNGNDGTGVTLSNADVSFFKLGNSTAGSLDTNTPLISPAVGGRLALSAFSNQGGVVPILQRFALITHGQFSQVDSMKFSLEHQNPLVVSKITGGNQYPSRQFSFVTISNPDVVLWSLKPSEEGINDGIIARVWNLASSPEDFSLNLNGAVINNAFETTHIETNIGPASFTSNSLSSSAANQQLKTYRLAATETSPATPTPTPTPSACQMADITQDSLVDLSDYSILAVNFLQTSPANPRADINADGVVDLSDYSLLSIQFLKTCN